MNVGGAQAIVEVPHSRRRVTLAACAVACVPGLFATLFVATRPAAAAKAHNARIHYACSSPNSAHVPCHFSTPSGNIRCLWTPSPNTIVCELLATGRAYRLRPTGKAKAVVVHLARRGETLPHSQQLVFPESLSCQDTNTTMTCNQDEGFGEFKLAPKGSHSS
ncbi:MAG: hypothetical protein ABR992_00060 [Solirubrobacteraceae bacterium]|jgi:hypothetical protein